MISICLIISMLLELLFISNALAAPFTAKQPADVLAAPATGTPKVASLSSGTIVEVTHQAGDYWRVEIPDGKTGYVRADALQQTKTKGAFIPLLISAGAPILKVVISKIVGWFKKLFGIKDQAAAKADQMFSVGKELILLGKNPGGWLKVKTAEGAVGYIMDRPAVVPLQPVAYADNSANQYDWMMAGAKPIPATANGLMVQAQVRKTDGTPVISGQTPLKLGDEYDIYISTSTDAYVRITAETKGMGNVCQYYPNHLPGTQQSIHFKAGYTYSGELLPQGIHYKVNEPIGQADILRVEVNTYAPYHYVDKPQGCVPKTKGPGFGGTTTYQNPTAQVVVEFEIRTVK